MRLSPRPRAMSSATLCCRNPRPAIAHLPGVLASGLRAAAACRGRPGGRMPPAGRMRGPRAADCANCRTMPGLRATRCAIRRTPAARARIGSRRRRRTRIALCIRGGTTRAAWGPARRVRVRVAWVAARTTGRRTACGARATAGAARRTASPATTGAAASMASSSSAKSITASRASSSSAGNTRPTAPAIRPIACA